MVYELCAVCLPSNSSVPVTLKHGTNVCCWPTAWAKRVPLSEIRLAMAEAVARASAMSTGDKILDDEHYMAILLHEWVEVFPRPVEAEFWVASISSTPPQPWCRRVSSAQVTCNSNQYKQVNRVEHGTATHVLRTPKLLTIVEISLFTHHDSISIALSNSSL